MDLVPLTELSQRLAQLLEAQDYDAGFALGRHILRHYPRHLLTYQQLGLAALEAGRPEDSVDLLQRALSANPENAAMWRGFHRAARALGLAREMEIAQAYAQDLWAARSAETSSGASILAQAHAAARAGDWPRAYQYFHQGYTQSPERMDAALGLAQALYHLGRFQAVQMVAQFILQELPYSLKAHLLLLLSNAQLEGEWIHVRRHGRVVRGLDPTGDYSQRWFAPQILAEFFDQPATLPPWPEEMAEA